MYPGVATEFGVWAPMWAMHLIQNALLLFAIVKFRGGFQFEVADWDFRCLGDNLMQYFRG
jgi:hypothetical protein